MLCLASKPFTHWPTLILSIGLSLAWGTVAMADTPEELVAKAMDPSAAPCDDFYRYACGGWIDSTGTPSDEPILTRGIAMAEEDIRNRLFILLQDAAARHPSGNPDQDRIGAFYKACMDEAGIDTDDLLALQPYFAAIDQVGGGEDFLRVAGQLHAIGANRLFTFNISPDVLDAKSNTLYLDPGDPGFPDGDLYTRNDRLNKRLRSAGRAYIADILVQLGETRTAATIHARQILAIEKVLGTFHLEYGKSTGLLKPPSPAWLQQISPAMPWPAFFQGAGADSIQSLRVSPNFLKALGKTLKRAKADTLRAYLRWSLISSYRRYLPAKYYRSILSEQVYHLAASPRWKTCVDHSSDLLGDATGKALSESADGASQLTPQGRALLEQVKASFAQDLPDIAWLNPQALAATQKKLDALTQQIGFPSVWPDLSSLTADPGNFLGNAIAARKFSFQSELARYNLPVDRNAWEPVFPPQTVNAFYSILKNQLHLLAGMLRSPFLDAGFPPPMNYAGLGFVAAHEVMHGFDDSGRHFQADGHYADLWPKAVNQSFASRSQCIVKQYSRYRVVESPKIRINGKKTLEENLSDTNGLKLAYQAFASADRNAPSVTYFIGSLQMTADQLFFVSYAQNFCSVSRPGVGAYLYSRSWWRYAPPRYRALGPLVNRPEFAEAFHCPVGAPMNPTKKCEVW